MNDEPLPLIGSQFDLTMFEPGELSFFRAPDGDARTRMAVRDELCYVDVRVARALPLTEPDRYLTIRDSEDHDIGLVVEWRKLDSDSLSLVDEALGRSHFLPKVVLVNKVTDNFGIILWDLVTDHGPKKYVVRNLRDNSVALTARRVLMTDVDGDRFEFPDIHAYGPQALEVLLKVL